MNEAPTPAAPAQTESVSIAPVADLNAATARRQKLLLTAIGAVVLAGGSWFILGGDDGANAAR
jgi:conjugal transfer pilus assembly protein TraB